MQVTIPPELEAYVEARVARGDYANLEELVKDSIRLLEKVDALAQRKFEELRESVQRAAEQLDRGEGVPFTEDVAEDIKRRGRERLAASMRRKSA